MAHLIFDPIDFQGGSKKAVTAIYSVSSDTSKTWVLSNDSVSWTGGRFLRRNIWLPKSMVKVVHGVPFLLKHLIYALQIVTYLVRYPDIKMLIATSGPGIDLGLYFARALLQPFKKLTLVQLIQGPVAPSRLSARCLQYADRVFYLENTRSSIEELNNLMGHGIPLIDDIKYDEMKNGLANEDWPCVTTNKSPRLFWAASNLKWKGLDKLISAMTMLHARAHTLEADICYIDASNQGYETSETNIPLSGVHWHESPKNLDTIRQQASIFVSTSYQEPFGLSILEALAAGLCVLIPQDSAYWDQHLIHNVNCIKYKANDADALKDALLCLLTEPDQINQIGQSGQQVALNYRASVRYKNITTTLFNELLSADNADEVTTSLSR